jgi:DNA-binding MarR family transcriptional regulator
VKFSLGKPTVSAVVDALCRNGLVIKSAVGDDQRASALALTDEGRRVLDEAERALVAVLRGLAEHGPQVRRVVETLAAVGAALEDQAQAREAVARGRRPARGSVT